MRGWQRFRRIAVVVAVSTALELAGCASLSRVVAPRPVCENPLIVPAPDVETVWKETVAIVSEYFPIRSENRLAGTVITDPVAGATMLEPWRGDSASLRERFESTLQTTRRFARVELRPVAGRGYAVKVEVLKEIEDLPKPDRQTAGRAVFNNDFPVNRTREIVGPMPVPLRWYPRGRDAVLEQAILQRLRDALLL
jgi:hypothetical protein